MFYIDNFWDLYVKIPTLVYIILPFSINNKILERYIEFIFEMIIFIL